MALPWLFEFWALPHQLAPEGVWKTWVIMGGRGAGKTRAGAEWIAERWLVEARISRDGLKLTLPPSMGQVAAGDVIHVPTSSGGRYRVDRVEHAGALSIEGTRIERAAYEPSDESEERIVPKAFVPPTPVYSVFLDLPLMSGAENPNEPHLAVTASPWPGSVALYGSDQDAGYVLKDLYNVRSTIGQTLSTLDAAMVGIWDRGAALRVKMTGEPLSSVSVDQLLNGANLLAIGDGSPGNWELLQFQQATLVSPDTYDLKMRLRGQAGTDATMPASWLAGSIVVLMNGAPKQIGLLPSERNLARHYRIGPARRPYSDPSYTHQVTAFSGIGLRPLSVSHLSCRQLSDEGLDIGWIRRTRTDGDNWSAYEVPLGEAREIYLLRIVVGGTTIREVTLGQTGWIYPPPVYRPPMERWGRRSNSRLPKFLMHTGLGPSQGNW